MRPTLVAPLIQNMRPLLRNVLGPGITKRFELDEAMMPVMADPTQLEVAVLNLAINARDAMPDGGILTFASRLSGRRRSGLEDGDYIELTISDTGSGMPPEVAERAFEPFFTTKEVGKGTGLGLSMVYGMARQSGGAARIESGPGKGTAVKLLFRKADAAVARRPRSPRPAAAAQAAGAASVLVIDDDPDVRGFIVDSARGAGLSSARGGRRARRDRRDRAREARPGDRRLHHARHVGRRSRKQNPRRSCPTSRSCSSPATARPTRSSAPRPTRRCSPSRSAPMRCTRRSRGALTPAGLNRPRRTARLARMVRDRSPSCLCALPAPLSRSRCRRAWRRRRRAADCSSATGC